MYDQARSVIYFPQAGRYDVSKRPRRWSGVFCGLAAVSWIALTFGLDSDSNISRGLLVMFGWAGMAFVGAYYKATYREQQADKGPS